MLQVVFSNRFEALCEQLLAALDTPPGDLFTSERIIVPGAAMQRTLELAIARHQGICGSVRFDYLAQWLWQEINERVGGVPDQSPFSPGPLTWRILRILGDEAFVAAHPRLAHYVHRGDLLMRYELAGELARLIEQYTTWRPDWTEAWAAGGLARIDPAVPAIVADQAWQSALMRRVITEVAVGTEHPAHAFIRTLGRTVAPPAETRPRVHIIGLPAIAPLYLAMIEALSAHMDIRLLLLNPCEAYWYDIVEPKRLRLLATRGRTDHHETGHRLLATWGRQTQALVGLLDQAGSEALIDDTCFDPSHPDTLLGHLQDAILRLDEPAPASVILEDDDRSIEVHACHSITRQVEVLHEQLLALFAADGTLEPADILVLTPDIDAIAPVVDSVFGTRRGRQYIPYTLAGVRPSVVNPVARALLDLLQLADSRVLASDVLLLLAQPLVARRFGLTPDDLDALRDWFGEAGIRWGLDASQRQSLDLPAEERFSFRDGIDRLLLGHALPADIEEPFLDKVAAGNATGSRSATLGSLCGFIDQLDSLRASAGQSPDIARWRRLLEDMLEVFLEASPADLGALSAVRGAIRELDEDIRAGGHDGPLPLALVARALTERLDGASAGSKRSGAVTIASMASMRALPARVMVLIGLDDGVFPTSTRADELDLMRASPRPGDRQRRDDERNLFLDTVLAARERLVLMHTGFGVRDNQPRPPSVLVAELLDHLASITASDAGSVEALARARKRLVVEHPLQSFSIRAFEPGNDERIASHDALLCEALQAGLRAGEHTAPGAGADLDEDENDSDEAQGADEDRELPFSNPSSPRFFDAPLPPLPAENRSVSMDELAHFLADPARAILRRLDIDTWVDDDSVDDDEPLAPDVRAERSLGRRLLPRLLDGGNLEQIRALAAAGIEYPAGPIGEAALARDLAGIAAFAAAVNRDRAGPALPSREMPIELVLDDGPWQVSARFGELRPGGLVLHSYRKHDDRMRVRAWVMHLCLSALAPEDAQARTILHLAGERIVLPPLASASVARTGLARLVALYREGSCEPLPFYPRSSMAYASAFAKAMAGKKKSGVAVDPPGNADKHHAAKAMVEARKAWLGSDWNKAAQGESASLSLQIALRGETHPLDARFRAIALELLGPMTTSTPAGDA